MWLNKGVNKKQWYIYTVEYYSVIKEWDFVLPNTVNKTWVHLKKLDPKVMQCMILLR